MYKYPSGLFFLCSVAGRNPSLQPATAKRSAITDISLNRHHPQIVGAASIRSTHTHMKRISDNDHQASTRAVHVVQIVSTADNRSTERLCRDDATDRV